MKRYITIILLFLTFNLQAQSEPDWINNYPIDDLHYIGIGSSNMGNKSEDYERALIQARLNLASEISTSIKAETEIITRDSSINGFSESFSEKLNQSVNQKLQELEIVDSYYSRSNGYWIYVRLNKIRWDQIQSDEMAALLLRIQKILNEDFFSPRVTTADKLFKLASVSKILNESPYGNLLKGTLGNVYTGNIPDFVQSEIYKISSSLSINISDHEYSMESGDDMELRFSLESSDNYPGKLPFEINLDGVKIYSLFSDINGLAKVQLFSSDLHKGQNNLSININPQDIGFPYGSMYFDSFVSERKEFSIAIKSSSIYLSINTNKNDMNFFVEPLRTLFSTGKESFQMTNERREASYEIVISLIYTDYPKILDNAPLMAGLDCIISLKKDNRLLVEHKIDSLKDGGLSYEQAYQRVFKKLIRNLETDRKYIEEIERALSQ